MQSLGQFADDGFVFHTVTQEYVVVEFIRHGYLEVYLAISQSVVEGLCGLGQIKGCFQTIVDALHHHIRQRSKLAQDFAFIQR